VVNILLYEYPKNKWNEMLNLFKSHKHFKSLIMGTIHEGFGQIFVDNLENPTNAALRYKMLTAFGGTGNGKVKEFFSLVPERSYLLCPNKEWISHVREFYNDDLTIVDRISVSSKDLNLNHIRKLKNNHSKDYEIVQLNDELVDTFEGKFLQRYSYFYGTLEVFKKKGFGFCALHKGKIVAVAATVLPFVDKEYEVQVDTLPEHREKGLATSVCAHLIEFSLKNGYDPLWDAFTPISAALAKKLGYTNPKEYQLLMLGEA